MKTDNPTETNTEQIIINCEKKQRSFLPWILMLLTLSIGAAIWQDQKHATAKAGESQDHKNRQVNFALQKGFQNEAQHYFNKAKNGLYATVIFGALAGALKILAEDTAMSSRSVDMLTKASSASTALALLLVPAACYHLYQGYQTKKKYKV